MTDDREGKIEVAVSGKIDAAVRFWIDKAEWLRMTRREQIAWLDKKTDEFQIAHDNDGGSRHADGTMNIMLPVRIHYKKPEIYDPIED